MRLLFVLALVLVHCQSMAGDSYSGPYLYSADFSHCAVSTPSPDDFTCAEILASRLGVMGDIELFVRTDLPLHLYGRKFQGQVYRNSKIRGTCIQ